MNHRDPTTYLRAPPTFCSLPKWAMKEFLNDSDTDDDEEEVRICSMKWECEYCSEVFNTFTEAMVHERLFHVKPIAATRIALAWRRALRRRAASVLVRWARRWSLQDAWQWDDYDDAAAAEGGGR